MIRKPEPKEAAKAIIAMFAAKGLTVNRSLALEVVATVEGFNDWNTMSAALAAAPVKTPKVKKAPKHPQVSDDDGPFLVSLDGGAYTTLERFSRAKDVAETFAAELDAEYIATIEDAAGKLRAMYVGDHTRFRVYYQDWLDASVAEAKRHVQDVIEHEVEADCTCFGHPENFHDHLAGVAASGIGDEGMTFVLGYRAFDTDPATGRVAHSDLNAPIQLGILVVRGELRYVCQGFPVDVRERIGALLT